jgi:hypothetical protein
MVFTYSPLDLEHKLHNEIRFLLVLYSSDTEISIIYKLEFSCD